MGFRGFRPIIFPFVEELNEEYGSCNPHSLFWESWQSL